MHDTRHHTSSFSSTAYSKQEQHALCTYTGKLPRKTVVRQTSEELDKGQLSHRRQGINVVDDGFCRVHHKRMNFVAVTDGVDHP